MVRMHQAGMLFLDFSDGHHKSKKAVTDRGALSRKVAYTASVMFHLGNLHKPASAARQFCLAIQVFTQLLLSYTLSLSGAQYGWMQGACVGWTSCPEAFMPDQTCAHEAEADDTGKWRRQLAEHATLQQFISG